MPNTPLGHFRRNKLLRYGYGAFANYRLASVTRGVPNEGGTEGASSPTSGEAELDVAQTMPTAAGDPVLAGRGSWPADTGSNGMSALRPEGGIAVSYTADVDGVGPGLYPRVNPADTAINATVDISVAHGDGDSDSSAFGATVDHRYAEDGTYTPQLVITDQLNRVSTQEMSTGVITVSADTTVPAFTAGPTAVNATLQTIATGFTVDDNATVYVVAVANGDVAPTADEVKAGTATGGAAAEASGSTTVEAATPATLVGLIPTSGAGSYDVYFVANDGTADQTGAPTAVTAVVVTASPTYTAGPTAADGGSTDIDVGFTSDTSGDVYVVAVLAGVTAPTAAEVIAGTASGGAAAEIVSNVTVTAATPATIPGLSPTTGAETYDVYFVVSDGVNTEAAAPTLVADVIVA